MKNDFKMEYCNKYVSSTFDLCENRLIVTTELAPHNVEMIVQGRQLFPRKAHFKILSEMQVGCTSTCPTGRTGASSLRKAL